MVPIILFCLGAAILLSQHMRLADERERSERRAAHLKDLMAVCDRLEQQNKDLREHMCRVYNIARCHEDVTLN